VCCRLYAAVCCSVARFTCAPLSQISVLQCFAAFCSVLHRSAVLCSVLQCVADDTLQCVAVWRGSPLHQCQKWGHSMRWHTATHCNVLSATHCNTLQHTTTHLRALNAMSHCNALQRAICNTLQWTATHCNTLQGTQCDVTLQQRVPRHTATHCNSLARTATHCASPHWITLHHNET